jgi:hypothetical protein
MLDRPIRFGKHEYSVEINLHIASLASRRSGVELAPLLARLESFPNRGAWSAYLRRALVPLTPRDAAVIEKALARVARSYDDSAPTYTV